MDQLLQEISLLSSTAATLGWDQETYMPPAAVEHRAKQLAYLSGKIHHIQTSEAYREALENDVGDSENLRELKYQADRAACLPQALVEKASETSSLAKATWSEAREKNEFQLFAPHLETLVDIAREQAEHWSYQDEAYDALLAGYERAATTREVSELFTSIEDDLANIAAQAVENSAALSVNDILGHAPVEVQQQFNREIAESLGFDIEQGRIDTTTHPFCTTLGPRDVRLTTRYDENDFTSSLFGVLHEAGHGLYEQGLPSHESHLPSGQAVSLGIHESQSRLWENHVGRSQPFWEKWYPRAQELFPHLATLSLEKFLKVINRAAYTSIRVEADEATYDLHILLRFAIERRLISGDLRIADVPAAWNEHFHKLFGFFPKNDSEGCLQDIHWSMGGIGYFATYSLGNINSAQLFAAAMKENSVSQSFSKGDFLTLLQWMKEHVHKHGSRLFPNDLMFQATGQKTQPDAYLNHLKNRFC